MKEHHKYLVGKGKNADLSNVSIEKIEEICKKTIEKEQSDQIYMFRIYISVSYTHLNDLSEDTRKELEHIYLALSQLAEKQKHVNKQTERRPIGFAHYKENNKK